MKVQPIYPDLKLEDIVNTEEIGEVKVVGIFELQVASLPNLSQYAYILQKLDDKSVWCFDEQQLTITP